jgi:hypothetical protein
VLCEVAQLLVQEHRAYHRELINSCCPDPCTYSIGNIVFACRATQSDPAKGRVDKLTYAFTGPWYITAILKGTSYELEHCSNPHQKEKKHASDLSPYPLELILLQPLDGSDTWYGQLHKPIMARPFKEAGINGFNPIKPFKISANFLTTDQVLDFDWPSLLELNDDLFPFPWLSEEKRRHYLLGNSISTLPVMYTGLPPSALIYSTPTIPPLSILTRSIIQSSNKLFFISNSIGTNEAREWQLVQVVLQDSISSYPPCVQNGRFLIEFYISHPADLRYNAINTHFWLQYHTLSELQSRLSMMDTHLIQGPSDSSKDYATQHKSQLMWLSG